MEQDFRVLSKKNAEYSKMITHIREGHNTLEYTQRLMIDIVIHFELGIEMPEVLKDYLLSALIKTIDFTKNAVENSQNDIEKIPMERLKILGRELGLIPNQSQRNTATNSLEVFLFIVHRIHNWNEYITTRWIYKGETFSLSTAKEQAAEKFKCSERTINTYWSKYQKLVKKNNLNHILESALKHAEIKSLDTVTPEQLERFYKAQNLITAKMLQEKRKNLYKT